MMSDEHTRQSLDVPWTGPWQVLQRGNKTFVMDWHGTPYSVSVERLQPAYTFRDITNHDSPDFPVWPVSASTTPCPDHSPFALLDASAVALADPLTFTRPDTCFYQARLFVILLWFSNRFVFIAYFPLRSYLRTCCSSASCRSQFRFLPFVSFVCFFPRCLVAPTCRLRCRFLLPTRTCCPMSDCSPRDTRRSARSNVSAARNRVPPQFLLRKCWIRLLESEPDYSRPFPGVDRGRLTIGFFLSAFSLPRAIPPELPQRARLSLRPDASS